ncbi:MAG TPA: CaiB/BaiF CoA-transferase family protein, partial [Thermoanaerobaculia bacterium]|nr:CaiB/BaiF CoA-transferase family protein [Thermoanaerobaculia bacterium]
MSDPLRGILVVDLSRHLPGPLAAQLLASLGARVVKVEEPRAGDPVRLAPPVVRTGPRTGTGPTSSLAALLLSGVESVALDLKRPGGREVLERLLERADVLLETFRPGTLARLGFPPEELRERFPRLVVCSLSGWGEDGPYAARAGHDLTYQALAGALAPTAATPAYPVTSILASL